MNYGAGVADAGVEGVAQVLGSRTASTTWSTAAITTLGISKTMPWLLFSATTSRPSGTSCACAATNSCQIGSRMSMGQPSGISSDSQLGTTRGGKSDRPDVKAERAG